MSDETPSTESEPTKTPKRRGRPPRAIAAAPVARVEPETVAPRNDPKALEPYAKSRSTQIKNQRPGRKYQYFRKDQIEYYTARHEIGSVHTGFLMVDAWKVEHQEPGGVVQDRQRDDAGKPVDTVVTNGELILLSTTDENHAKYAVIERKHDELKEARFTGGQKLGFGKTSFKTRTIGGREGLEASASDVLQGAA